MERSDHHFQERVVETVCWRREPESGEDLCLNNCKERCKQEKWQVKSEQCKGIPWTTDYVFSLRIKILHDFYLRGNCIIEAKEKMWIRVCPRTTDYITVEYISAQ